MSTIDKILFVSDDNPNYLSFWPSISKYYWRRFGLKSHLFYLGGVNQDTWQYLKHHTFYADVSIYKPFRDIPIIIQALWGKFWFTQKQPDVRWLIGDIDLYLLNEKYLDLCLEATSRDDYVHINANGYHMGDWWNAPKFGLPGYFHLATGHKFKEFLGLSDSFREDCEYIYNSKKYGICFNGVIPNKEMAPARVKDKQDYEYICCEEHLSTERLIPHRMDIKSFTYPGSVFRLEAPLGPGGSAPKPGTAIRQHFSPYLKNSYIDFHAPRPYFGFGDDIEWILSHYIN